MKTTFLVLITLTTLFLGYELMVRAFHLLNLPSDAAVYEGMAILALLVFLPFVFVKLWRSL